MLFSDSRHEFGFPDWQGTRVFQQLLQPFPRTHTPDLTEVSLQRRLPGHGFTLHNRSPVTLAEHGPTIQAFERILQLVRMVQRGDLTNCPPMLHAISRGTQFHELPFVAYLRHHQRVSAP